MCTGLPVVSKSGSQPGRQPTPPPCLSVFLVLCHRSSANFSAHLSCPLCSDSSPEGISAKEPCFTYQASQFCDGIQLSRSRSSQVHLHRYNPCNKRTESSTGLQWPTFFLLQSPLRGTEEVGDHCCPGPESLTYATTAITLGYQHTADTPRH